MKQLILDVDTGIDDALAIAYALGSDELELLAVTCSFGNVKVEKAVSNTQAILHLLGADHIPVYPGVNRLFDTEEEFIPNEVCKRVHGANGIGNITILGVKEEKNEIPAFEFMASMAEKYGEDLIIVATASMANLARFIKLYPEAAAKTGKIAIMGGALTVPGNVNRYAEANMLADPAAAKYLFESGIPILMIGLDITLKTMMSAEEMERWIAPWRGLQTEAAEKFADMVHYYCNNEVGKAGAREGAIHDPLAVAAALHPGLVTSVFVNLTVETEGESKGRTIGDLKRLKDPKKTAEVCIDVRVEEFMKEFVERTTKALAHFSNVR